MIIKLFKKNCCFIVGIMLLVPALYSCDNASPVKKKDTLVFKEITHRIVRVGHNDKILKFKIGFNGINVLLDLNVETESAVLTIGGQTVLTDLNFVYDTDLESALEEIKILKSTSDEDIIVVLPMTTEEFPTLELIKFESKLKAFKKSRFEINTHKYDNVRNFYLDNQIDLTLKKDSFELSLSDFKCNGKFEKFEK